MPTDLVRRLRGIHTDTGAGPLAGTARIIEPVVDPVRLEAAVEIERLTAALAEAQKEPREVCADCHNTFMTMPPGEAVDRLSILVLKLAHGLAVSERREAQAQVARLREELTVAEWRLVPFSDHEVCDRCGEERWISVVNGEIVGGHTSDCTRAAALRDTTPKGEGGNHA
jgi:hypothetical protein